MKLFPDIPEWIDQDAWIGYFEMRKAIKKPLTERAIKIAIRRLDSFRRMGHNPNAILDQSTFLCWQGLFPLRQDQITPKKQDLQSQLDEIERKHGLGSKTRSN